jgi:hypothetical protein
LRNLRSRVAARRLRTNRLRGDRGKVPGPSQPAKLRGLPPTSATYTSAVSQREVGHRGPEDVRQDSVLDEEIPVGEEIEQRVVPERSGRHGHELAVVALVLQPADRRVPQPPDRFRARSSRSSATSLRSVSNNWTMCALLNRAAAGSGESESWGEVASYPAVLITTP